MKLWNGSRGGIVEMSFLALKGGKGSFRDKA